MEYGKEGKMVKKQKSGIVKKRKGHKGSKEKRKKHE